MKNIQIGKWPEDELENVKQCPICGNKKRTLLYKNITDSLYQIPGQWTYYVCSFCKVAYLDPRPTKGSIGKAYINYLTHNDNLKTPRQRSGFSRILLSLRNDYLNWKFGYSERPFNPLGRFLMYFLPPFYRHEWDYHARSLPQSSQPARKLLDVGCGNGDFLIQAQKGGWEVMGVDFDPVSVDLARRHGLNVVLGSITEQVFPEGYFDCITHRHVIEHVHDPVEFLMACYRTLSPGGRMWIVTPNIHSTVHRLYREKWP